MFNSVCLSVCLLRGLIVFPLFGVVCLVLLLVACMANKGYQIVNKEGSFYIYDRPLTEINVMACFSALNLRIKF